jgi:hypothetical protein
MLLSMLEKGSVGIKKAGCMDYSRPYQSSIVTTTAGRPIHYTKKLAL